MEAKICDSCNRTLPLGSSYFVHEYIEQKVGEASDTLCYKPFYYRPEKRTYHEVYELCPMCHARVRNYILDDDFKLDGVEEEGNGKDSAQDS